jgi:sugar (pentulose or hexulose) kinase
LKEFDVCAINYTAYGASFVHVDEEGKELTPLYNYLKPYPPDLQEKFYRQYGGETEFSHVTASPVLGNLNSGLQIYRLKYQKPGVFKKIRAALHLPQYLCQVLTGRRFSDMTSIGSHTALWDFTKNDYHEWVEKEGVINKLPPIHPHTDYVKIIYKNKELISGIGLHDSSAALIPYLVSFPEPFVLLSTGTWSITLSPFNDTPLSTEELQQDCLCYLSYEGKPVKASRLFAGHEHAEEVDRIAARFKKPLDFYTGIQYDPSLINDYGDADEFPDPSLFDSYEEAYHHMIHQLVQKQVHSTGLVMQNDVKNIFVDGGFSKNPVFMNILAAQYPGKKVYAATISQCTALGAALVMHDIWNDQLLSKDLITLKSYSPGLEIKQ